MSRREINRLVTTGAVVYFDGSCPLCRREIHHYRGCKGADRIHWIDISLESYDAEAHNLDRDVAMTRFHVLDAQGRWQTGVRGFVTLWSELPGYRWAAVLVSGLHLITPLEWLYVRFAAWRVQRRCAGPQCRIKS